MVDWIVVALIVFLMGVGFHMLVIAMVKTSSRALNGGKPDGPEHFDPDDPEVWG